MPELTPEDRIRLKAELVAPYRGLRQFVYLSLAASGLIGGVVFAAKLLAGREIETALPSFALQAGVVALMFWLFRLDQRAGERLRHRLQDQERKAKR